jgi:hypothetical protein
MRALADTAVGSIVGTMACPATISVPKAIDRSQLKLGVPGTATVFADNGGVIGLLVSILVWIARTRHIYRRLPFDSVLESLVHSGSPRRRKMSLRSACATATIVSVVLLAEVCLTARVYAQQSTGQLLISSGFNPIAATTPELLKRLMSFPPNQFQLRQKGGRSYYVYADPSGCTCAYVGSVAAMNKYRAGYGALPADTLSAGGFTDPEQNMINSMDNDEASAQFNDDVFGPDF